MPTIEEIQAANATELAKDASLARMPDVSGKAAAPAAKAAPKVEAAVEEEVEDEGEGEEENPLTAKKEDAEGSEEEDEGEESEEEETPKPKAKAEKAPWWRTRIAQLTAVSKRSEAENAALKAALAAKGKAEGTTEAEAGTEEKAATEAQLTEAEIERRVEAKAAIRVAQQEFDNQCNSLYTKGKGEFPDWQTVLDDFTDVGGLSVPMLQAVLELDYPHRVLHALSKDKEEASRILSLPPLKMAVAIAKIEGTKPKEKKLTKAPAPIEPVKGKAKAEKSLDDPTLSEAEFADRRDKEVAERKARRFKH